MIRSRLCGFAACGRGLVITSFLLVLALVPAMAAEAPADLVLLNGRIWTGATTQPWAEAVAVHAGRFLAVGTSSDIGRLAGSHTRSIDLGGRLVVPGFTDAHTHFMNGGFQLSSIDLRDARSPEEFARRIAERAAKSAPGKWILGGDWDHEMWLGAPLPTRELLDPSTRDIPVFISRLDGHMALANTVVLRMAKITKETKDPPGGTIVRDAKTGEPTGVLKDAAMELVLPLIPEPSDAECAEALDAALREAASLGVTSIHDITSWRDFDLYKRFQAAGRLTVRIYARTPLADWKRQAEYISKHGAGDAWLRLGGFKAYMDGSLGSTTALFFEPYVDSPSTTGLMSSDNLPEGKIKDLLIMADKAGLQCSIHAIGDKANKLLLDYYEEVAKLNGPRDRRFRIEHAQHIRPADIPRFAQLGVVPSMQPYHCIDDGRWAEKRIGPERIKSTYAFRTLIDTGATLAFGSDWNVAPLSPILGIYAAVTRETTDGKNPKGWVPEQKITVAEAVRAYTAGCAYAEFAERDKGTIEPGKLADFAILSHNIFSIEPDAIAKTSVVATIAGGCIVYGEEALAGVAAPNH